MTRHHFVREGQVLASEETEILALVLQYHGRRFGRDFFRYEEATKKRFGVYEEVTLGQPIDDDFTAPTDSGPAYDGEQDRVVRSLGGVERPLTDIRDRLKDRVTARFRQARDAGVTVGGVQIATTNDSYNELQAGRARAAAQGTVKAVTRSRMPIEFDATEFAAVLDVVEDYRDACGEREHDLYLLIDAAADATALAAIDIETGWPGQP